MIADLAVSYQIGKLELSSSFFCISQPTFWKYNQCWRGDPGSHLLLHASILFV